MVEGGGCGGRRVVWCCLQFLCLHWFTASRSEGDLGGSGLGSLGAVLSVLDEEVDGVVEDRGQVFQLMPVYSVAGDVAEKLGKVPMGRC